MNDAREVPIKRKNLSHLFTGTLTSVAFGIVGSLILTGVKWHLEGYPAVIDGLVGLVAQESQAITMEPTWILFIFDRVSSEMGAVWLSMRASFEAFFNQRSLFEGAISIGHQSQGFLLFIQRVGHVVGFVLWIAVLKVLSIVSAFRLFVFSSLIGSLDGLLARYIRTSEGGRESAFFFHHVSDVLLSLPALVFFGVLMMPFFISPFWVKSCLALLFFVFFRTQASSLKKFL